MDNQYQKKIRERTIFFLMLLLLLFFFSLVLYLHDNKMNVKPTDREAREENRITDHV